jgi:uncharacterized phage protein (TIGR01671 family)
MREYKFRVWDLEKKFYLNQDEEFHFYEPDRGWQCPIPLCECLRDKKRYVVQQYTGMRDENNYLIFEGDLVELHTAANDHAKNIKENHYGLYEIYWNRKYKLSEIKPNWFFKVIDNDCASFNIMKVVGNVFENPELLK